MNYNTSKIESSQKQYHISVDDKSMENGISSLKKGQQVNGLVISVKDRVTLKINGQELFASKDIFQSVSPGDIKVFDVVNATMDMIELKLVKGNTNMDSANPESVSTVLRLDTDQEVFMALKEQTGQAAKQQKEILEIKKQLGDIISKMNSTDYMLLEEEGFAPEDLTPESLSSALKRIKEKKTSSNSQDAKNEDNKLNKSTLDLTDIEGRLKSAGLPSSKEDVNGVSSALKLSNTVSKMNDKTMKYMISGNMEPSIENIYKAYYSQSTWKEEQSLPLTETAWNELKPQVTEIIQRAGFEENSKNLASARWMLDNNLPFTTQSFTFKNQLEDLASNSSEDQILNKVIDGMKNGTAPQKVSLCDADDASYEQVVEDVQSITEETIEKAVRNKEPLTIKHLKDLQKEEDRKKSNQDSVNENGTTEVKDSKIRNEVSDDQSNAVNMRNNTEVQTGSDTNIISNDNNLAYEEIKAKRQLEEIRLKMTVEAAAKLEKKGFHIETERLEKVVEELRRQEENYYKDLLAEAGAETSDANIETLKNTTNSMEQLKSIPSYVLGSTLTSQSAQTIPTLLSEGANLSAKLIKAGLAYDNLMSVPNKEYGDSIQKAFSNINSILSDLNLENTEANQRAVRILGYNQMEINQDSIDKVKAYDLKVNSLIKNLNPAVTVRLIKEGINPLNMPISDLNQTIDDLKEEQGITSEDRFSTYLNKLEKDNAISEQERKGYIGIYRLLYQIDKTDGAALGSLIKTNQEVTLNNLLSAVKTLKKGSLDETIDDSFGTLQNKSYSSDTISEQLNTGFNMHSDSQSYGSDDSEKADYIKQLAKLIEEDISPQELQEMQKESLSKGYSSANINTGIPGMVTTEQGIWDMVKDMSLDKLYENLGKHAAQNEIQKEVYEDKLKQLKDTVKNSDQALRFLNDFKIAATPANLMQMSQILNSGESPIKKFLKEQKEKQKTNNEENSETGLMEITELSDKLIDKTSMQEAYEDLEKQAMDSLEESISDEEIDTVKFSEYKSIGAQLSLLKSLAGKEFYQIPIDTDNGITNMNLTILRNTEKTGRVSAVIQSDHLGNVKADFSLKDLTLKGYIRCDNRNSLDILKSNMTEVERTAEDEGMNITQISYGLKNNNTESYDYLNKSEESSEVKISSDTERKLYKIAKAMVLSVRAAEQSVNIK